MRAIAVLKALGPIDVATVRRDSFLAWITILPLLIGALMRWGVPVVTDELLVRFDFDLTPYHMLITSYFVVLIVPLIVGQIIGFLLLDERDDDTLRALLVTPLPLEAYLAYRVGFPLVVCLVVAVVALEISGLVTLPWHRLAPIAVLYALEVPILALLMASVCENKVQGFAFAKAMGTVVLVPVAAYFLDPPWQYAAAIVPPFWPMKAFWLASEGAGGYWAVIAVGFGVHIAILWWLMARFQRAARH